MTAHAGGVELDVSALVNWMSQRGLDVAQPVSIARIGKGHSNLTYEIDDAAGRRWVVRRPPLGPLLPSAHDVVREARIMAALAETAVAVPQIHGVCETNTVADVPVVLMEHVDGLVIDQAEIADGLDEPVRAAIGPAMARTLADIHAVNIDAVGLGDLASRSPYAERQLRRWTRQWEASRTRDLPSLDKLTDLLTSRIPKQAETTLVHGDFHVRNVIIDADDGSIRAGLDWELSTLGDPVADLGTTLAYWPEPGEDSLGGFAQVAAPGFARRNELTEVYLGASGRHGGSLGFWHVLGLWKIAIIAEGVLQRVLAHPENLSDGTAPLGHQIAAMVDHAWCVADQYGLT